jgi:hypothetical protein
MYIQSHFLSVIIIIICIIILSGVRLSPLGTAATTGLLYQPQMMVTVEQLVEWRLAGETEVPEENLPQCHFVHLKSHMTWPGLEPGPPPELWHGHNNSDGSCSDRTSWDRSYRRVGRVAHVRPGLEDETVWGPRKYSLNGH